MNILDILSQDAVKVPLQATDRQGAIFELVDVLAATGAIHFELVDVLAATGAIQDADSLKEVVWEREQQRSTGIGEGLAIPHGKSPCAPKLALAIGRPAEPIDFASVDRQPVKLIILLASPPDKTADHIQALGKISRLMSRPDFRAQAYAAESAEALYELFRHG